MAATILLVDRFAQERPDIEEQKELTAGIDFTSVWFVDGSRRPTDPTFYAERSLEISQTGEREDVQRVNRAGDPALPLLI
jgi:hypothetical protein